MSQLQGGSALRPAERNTQVCCFGLCCLTISQHHMVCRVLKVDNISVQVSSRAQEADVLLLVE